MKLDKFLEIANVDRELVKESKYGKLLKEGDLKNRDIMVDLYSYQKYFDRYKESLSHHSVYQENIKKIKFIEHIQDYLNSATSKIDYKGDFNQGLGMLHKIREDLMSNNFPVKIIGRLTEILDALDEYANSVESDPWKLSRYVDKPHEFKVK